VFAAGRKGRRLTGTLIATQLVQSEEVAIMFRRTLLSALIVCLLLCLRAAAKASPPPDQPFDGIVVGVVEGKVTLTDPLGLTIESFLVHPGARITLNGKLVKLFDLRPGDLAVVFARPGMEAMGIRAVRR
jgi:hypothetical protein